MRPSEVLLRASQYLARHGVESPRETAEVLLGRALGTDRAGLYARSRELSPAEARAFGRALCRRCAGTPLQHITGEQRFRRLDLVVRPGVFVPRPETEELVSAALSRIEGAEKPVVVDVGTGTGAVALSIKDERPDAVVLATDISPEAVRLASDNARRLGLDVEILEGDGLDPLPGRLRGGLDLVVANPPYVRPEEYSDLPAEVLAEPALALVGGIDFLADLTAAAASWLRRGGSVAFEIGAAQGKEAARELAASFADIRVLPDLAGRDRVVVGRLP